MRRVETDLWEWNHRFWLHNNLRFEAAKSAFFAAKNLENLSLTNPSVKAAKTEGDNEEAEFYCNYLRQHKGEFRKYLVEWWRRHLALIGQQLIFSIKQRLL